MLSSKEESFSLVAFSGQQGFSGFRLKALLEEINADFPSITAVECKEIYLCLAKLELMRVQPTFHDRFRGVLDYL